MIEMVISTNPRPTIYRNFYKNTGYTHFGDDGCDTERQKKQEKPVDAESHQRSLPDQIIALCTFWSAEREGWREIMH